MTLNEMKIGSTAVIRQVGGEGPLRCRLLDMGLIRARRSRCKKWRPWAILLRFACEAMS